MHLFVFEFASVGIMLVLFRLTKGAGVPKNYVLLLALMKLIKNTTSFHDCVMHKNQHLELTLQNVLYAIYIYWLDVYCQKSFLCV